jgi:hypothetical protein
VGRATLRTMDGSTLHELQMIIDNNETRTSPLGGLPGQALLVPTVYDLLTHIIPANALELAVLLARQATWAEGVSPLSVSALLLASVRAVGESELLLEGDATLSEVLAEIRLGIDDVFSVEPLLMGEWESGGPF